MVFLYCTLILMVSLLLVVNIYRIRLLRQTPGGKLPKKGKATMFDVRHLLMEGEKDLALQLYCKIFNAPLPKAKKDIEELQRSLRV